MGKKKTDENNFEVLASRLEDISAQKEFLDKEEKVIKEALLDVLKQSKQTKVELQYGNLSIVSRTTYTFSDAIKKMEEKVSIKKEDEIKQGIATPSFTEYLRYGKRRE